MLFFLRFSWNSSRIWSQPLSSYRVDPRSTLRRPSRIFATASKGMLVLFFIFHLIQIVLGIKSMMHSYLRHMLWYETSALHLSAHTPSRFYSTASPSTRYSPNFSTLPSFWGLTPTSHTLCLIKVFFPRISMSTPTSQRSRLATPSPSSVLLALSFGLGRLSAKVFRRWRLFAKPCNVGRT